MVLINMIDVDYIMSLIDWNQSSEKQKTGIQMAKNIQSINVFLQPCNKNYKKMYGITVHKFYQKEQMTSYLSILRS